MRKTLLLLSLLVGFFSYSEASKILILSDRQEYPLTKENISVYKDPDRLLDYRSVLKKDFSRNEIDWEAPDCKTSNFWIKFTVKNNSSNQKWFLEMPEFGIQKVVFYDVSGDSLFQTGYSEKFFQRAYSHKNFVFDLSLPSGETRTFLVMASSSSTFGPIMNIRSNSLFISYAAKEYMLLGIYYGLLILIAVYTFFLYISIRDSSHLYYIFYVLAIGLRSLHSDGLGFQYLWPSFPEFNNWLNFAPQLLLLSFAVYSINFLELRKKNPVYYKSILLSLAFYILFFAADKFLSFSYITLIYLIPYLLIYSIAIIVYRQGYKPARFFILGYTLLILSQVSYFLISAGLYVQNEILIIILFYSLNIGFVIEVFIFSIALADKIKLLKKEKETAQQLIIDQLKLNEKLKDKVNRELEFKVSERTKELEDAKTKLQLQAEKINKMNQVLDLENYQLKTDAKELNIERGLLKAMSFEDFARTFPDKKSCFRFIEELKWQNGYTCSRCGNPKYTTSKDLFARKCTKCHYIETIQANTIFHNVKFPIDKAFQLIYLVMLNKEKMSTYDLGHKLNLQQKTCWSFRQKILDKMKKEKISKKDILEKGWGILIITHHPS